MRKMKAGMPSVCSLVPENSKQHGRQTSICNFFVGLPSSATKTVSLPVTSSEPMEEDRDASCSDRTNSSLHDAENNVGVASSLQSCDKVLVPLCGNDHPNQSVAANRMMKRKRATSQQQLYLDFGQRNFGKPIICTTCGMLMVHGVAADVQRHASVCRNYQAGIPWNDSASLQPCWEWTLSSKRKVKETCGNENIQRRHSTKGSRILFDCNGSPSTAADRAHIVEIRPTDLARYRKRLQLLHSIVDQELGFVSHSQETKLFTTFLCIVNKRVVGMVLVEEISAAYRLLLPSSASSPMLQFGLTRSAHPTKAVLGIYQLWVHHQYRHRGIASVMVDVARKQMVFGYSPVPVQHVAFSSPTESGLAFAQYYYSLRCNTTSRPPHPSSDDPAALENSVLVYDCG